MASPDPLSRFASSALLINGTSYTTSSGKYLPRFMPSIEVSIFYRVRTQVVSTSPSEAPSESRQKSQEF
ncbi:unnamed protein product [Boreogadus saida]